MSTESGELSSDIKNTFKIQLAVGSRNPVKVNAVREAFRAIHPEFEILVEGFEVESKVRSQPFEDDETLLGATNRAMSAYNEFVQRFQSPPKYSLGIEGGLRYADYGLECFAWITIFNGSTITKSRSASFMLPPSIEMHIRDGMELGDADDLVFGRKNSKQGSGSVGHLTNGLIDRTSFYKQPVILAYIPYMWPDHYNSTRK